MTTTQQRQTAVLDIPEWVTETPGEWEYRLLAEEAQVGEQDIHLTREEYIALKERLAELRRLKPAEQPADS
jgi:hypothetical protein